MNYLKLEQEAVCALRALESGTMVTASPHTLERLLDERLISIGPPPISGLVILRRGRHVLRGCERGPSNAHQL